MLRNHNQIRIAVRKFAPFESALQKIWEAYCKETGTIIQLEAIPFELPALYNEILGKEGLKNGNWDIAYMNTDWIMEANSSGAVENIAPYIQNKSPGDYPYGWPQSLLNLQTFPNKIIGLPLHDGPECLIYRKDLFEDEGEKASYFRQFGEELSPPKTWDDFLNIARFFNRPDRDLYGAVFAAYPDGHNTVFDFCLQVWTRGGKLTDKNDHININSATASEGLEFYRTILQDHSAVHPHCADFDSVKAGIAFSQGEAAMMINWFGFASFCEISEQSKIKGKVNIAPIPHSSSGSSVSLNIYWLYTIGSGSCHKTVAYDFIRFAVNKYNDKLLTMEGGIGCRISTFHDAEVNAIIPYYYKLEDLHKNAKTLPKDSYWSKIALVIDKMIMKAINTSLATEKILKEGQDEINKITNTRYDNI